MSLIQHLHVVLQSAVTCLLWPAEHAIVYGLVDGKVRQQHVLAIMMLMKQLIQTHSGCISRISADILTS